MFSLQQHIFSKTELCTRERFNQVVGSQEVASLCSEIEKLKNQIAQTPPNKEELATRAQNLKKKLPGFIFCATFPDCKRKQQSAVLNGLFMADFDHVDNPREVFNEAMKKPAFVEWFGHYCMLCHITPSGHGLRFVGVCELEKNLFENAAALGELIGLECDRACKDASRLSYAVPKEHILFIDDKIFNYENTEYNEKWGEMYRGGYSGDLFASANSSKSDATTCKSNNTKTAASNNKSAADAETNNKQCGEYCGVKISDIISRFWEKTGGEPSEGNRNISLFKLVCNIRYILDFNKDRIKEVIPTYGLQSDEVDGIIKQALSQKRLFNIPKQLNEIIVELRRENNPDGYVEEKENPLQEAWRLDEVMLQRLDKLKLSKFWSCLFEGVSPKLRNGWLLASLPMLYTLATKIRFNYIDGHENALCGMTTIVGPAASGKSFILELNELLMSPLILADANMRELERQYKENKERNKNAKELPPRPHLCIRIVPMQMSNAMLSLRMHDATDDTGRQLHIYSCESELATVVRASRGGSWIQKNDIYCKAFSGERWGVDYANEQSINGEIPVLYNFCVAGTEEAFKSFIPKSDLLGGLPTRLMFYEMPDNSFEMLPKKNKKRSAKSEEYIKNIVTTLINADGVFISDKLNNAIFKWCEQVAYKAKIENDYELDSLRRRAALIGYRAGVMYALIENIENKRGLLSSDSQAAINFAIYVAEYILQSQYIKFASSMRDAKKVLAEQTPQSKAAMRVAGIYNKLPVEFSTQSLTTLMPDLNPSTMRSYIHRWKNLGLISETKVIGTYKKIIKSV